MNSVLFCRVAASSNQALHLTAFSLRSKAPGELGRYVAIGQRAI